MHCKLFVGTASGCTVALSIYAKVQVAASQNLYAKLAGTDSDSTTNHAHALTLCKLFMMSCLLFHCGSRRVRILGHLSGSDAPCPVREIYGLSGADCRAEQYVASMS